MNTELANTEPLLPGEIQGSFPASLWSPSSFIPSITHQPIPFVYVGFCLKTPHFMYIVDSLTLNCITTALQFIPAQADLMHLFPL